MSERSRQRRCVFVIGPESSGSMLVSRIVAHALDVRPYGKWNAVGWSHGDLPLGEASEAAQQAAVASRLDTVCHRSLPYRDANTFPDIDQWLARNQDAASYFILTTRDVSVVAHSKRRRFKRTEAELGSNRERSRQMIADILRRGLPCFIWSYETFVYLREDYLRLLYAFLGVASDFCPPDLFDGNEKYIVADNKNPAAA